MGFFKRLFNKVKRLGKQTVNTISKRIGKSIHNISNNISPIQPLTQEERVNIDFLKQSYKPLVERKERIDGYILNKQYSNVRTSIYIDDKKIKYVLRGSKTAQDWINNLDIMTGSQSENSRFKEDLEYFSEIYNIFKDYSFYLLGHSQAGSIVNYIAFQYPSVSGMVFNAGHGFSNNSTPSNIKQIRSSKDIVSLLGLESKTKNIDLGDDKGIIDNHTLRNV